jgi:hypothetical protein
MPGVPPVPIPNTAVKPRAANGSWTLGPARVGCCQVYSPALRKKSRASFFMACGEWLRRSGKTPLVAWCLVLSEFVFAYKVTRRAGVFACADRLAIYLCGSVLPCALSQQVPAKGAYLQTVILQIRSGPASRSVIVLGCSASRYRCP